MKKTIQIAITMACLFLLVAITGCERPQVVKPKPKPVVCHVEMTYNPITSSVIAVEYRVQKGQKPTDIVKMHTSNPNMVGGPFLDYTEEMFFTDNPEIKSSPKRTIRKDKCDPDKVDTLWYQDWGLQENDLVYLRIPARLDTILGSGINTEWRTPTKETYIKYVVDRVEVAITNLSQPPVMGRYENPCDIAPTVVTGDVTLATPSPPDGDDGGNDGNSDIPWWGWLLLVLILFGIGMLIGFIHLSKKMSKKHTDTQNNANERTKEVCDHVTKQHATTHNVIKNDGYETRVEVEGIKKGTQQGFESIVKEMSKQRESDERQRDADREFLREQLDAERKSQKEMSDQFFKALSDQGKGPKGKKGEE